MLIYGAFMDIWAWMETWNAPRLITTGERETAFYAAENPEVFLFFASLETVEV